MYPTSYGLSVQPQFQSPFPQPLYYSPYQYLPPNPYLQPQTPQYFWQQTQTNGVPTYPHQQCFLPNPMAANPQQQAERLQISVQQVRGGIPHAPTVPLVATIAREQNFDYLLSPRQSPKKRKLELNEQLNERDKRKEKDEIKPQELMNNFEQYYNNFLL
mmetsp:Transcript_20495/g.26562  ORF Transcript_20495/g.26562 Transcript_20495/m.26562 type:complete len:159 (-) Transcript_20495:24-500(-)